MVLRQKNKSVFLKILGLFSIIRGFNILIIVFAQYLSSVFIAAPKHLRYIGVLLEVKLLAIVLASSLSIAGGYIINSFYDSEKDWINRPQKTMLDRLVGQQNILSAYFVFNFLSVILASYVSFRAVLFFSGYIFLIWLYSHKFKKILLLGNIIAAALAILPFFAIFVYYRNFNYLVLLHASFLFIILLLREITKDLGNIKGDLIQNYNTIAVVHGEQASKIIITLLILCSFGPVSALLFRFDIGYMYLYFYAVVLLLIVFMIVLWKTNTKQRYLRLYLLLKGILVAGVFSILLLDKKLVNKLFAAFATHFL